MTGAPSARRSAAVRSGAIRRERTRTAILDAAERLTGEKAADEIRVEEIAAAAEVVPATVYGHFATKDELLAEVVDRLLAVVMESVDLSFDAARDPFEQFVALGSIYLQILLDHPAILRYLNSVGDHRPATGPEIRTDRQIDLLRRAVEDLAAKIADTGQLEPVDPRLLSFFLVGTWNGVAALALRNDSLRLERADIEAAVAQAINGLAFGVLRR